MIGVQKIEKIPKEGICMNTLGELRELFGSCGLLKSTINKFSNKNYNTKIGLNVFKS